MTTPTIPPEIEELLRAQQARILKLEEAVGYLLQRQADTDSVQTIPPSESAQVQHSVEGVHLDCSSLQIQKWFAKRPFPDFEVRVVDNGGSLFTQTSGWLLGVRVLSGFDIYVDHIVHPAKYPIVEGRCLVTGLRFAAVSSRNGGHFQFEIAVTNAPSVAPVRSPAITILSERLRIEGKVNSILELRPNDSLSRAPGIGKKYAQRMAECGVRTVRDLAAIDAKKQKAIIEIVRRNRGQLTEARLTQLCKGAQAVLDAAARCKSPSVASENLDNDAEPPPKRLKVRHELEEDLLYSDDMDDVDAMLDLTRTDEDNYGLSDTLLPMETRRSGPDAFVSLCDTEDLDIEDLP